MNDSTGSYSVSPGKVYSPGQRVLQELRIERNLKDLEEILGMNADEIVGYLVAYEGKGFVQSQKKRFGNVGFVLTREGQTYVSNMKPEYEAHGETSGN
jgi:hypothetical protein